MDIEKKINSKLIFIILIGLSLLFFLTDLLVSTMGFKLELWESNVFRSLYRLVGTMEETSVPTLFSVLNLIFSAILLWILGNRSLESNQKYSYFWFLLAFIFCFLAIDEGTLLHERVGRIVRDALDIHSGSPMFYSWVIPYGILALGVGILSIRFLLYLPQKVAIGFVLGGAIFVTGAIGFEILEALESDSQSKIYDPQLQYEVHNYSVYVYSAFEELFEMVGISLFNYTMLKYLAEQKTRLSTLFT